MIKKLLPSLGIQISLVRQYEWAFCPSRILNTRKLFFKRMKKEIPLLLLLFASCQMMAQSTFMKQYYAQHYSEPLDVFVQNFPYANYLDEVAFTDFKTLQTDRYFLWKKKGDGDDFLYYLGENFIKYYPVELNHLEKKIEIGEAFLNPNKGFNRPVDEIYQIIGYFILSKVAHQIEEAIKKDDFNQHKSRNQKLIKRLEANKVYLSVEESTSSKLFKNLKQGNFIYIFDRIWLRFKAHFQPFAQFLNLESKFLYLVLGLVLMLLTIFFFVSIFSKNFFRSGLSLFSLTAILIFPLFLPNRSASAYNPSKQYTLFKMNFVKNYIPLRGSKNHAINIMKIEDEKGKEIGQAIWMQRPHLKAKYFAYQNVSNKFYQFKQQEEVILATTGGFTNSFHQPEGLTVENGNIVNAVLMHDRHGLVMVRESGGINVLNLKRDQFHLPLGNKKVKTINNPLESLVAYSELLSWCKTVKATMFQTQLLAYSDKLLIKPGKAKSQLRERRILALFSDRNTGAVHHAIFNIEASYELATIAEEVYSLVASRNKKIEAILNLDVGSYNILEVYDDQEKRLNYIKGPVKIGDATNLIVYTK